MVVTTLLSSCRYSSDPFANLQVASRPLEARLTRFHYAPYRGIRSAEMPQSWRSLEVAARFAEAAQNSPTAEHLHQYALAQIALGKKQSGVQLLREALQRDPENASILADLAAAQIATDAVEDAAESAGKAMEYDPSSATAAFNWALALEALSNRRAAVKAWKDYLSLDATTPWAAEAKEHLARLSRPRPTWEHDKSLLAPRIDDLALSRIVATYPQRVRSWTIEELLPRYIEYRREEDLALLEAIGNERSKTGDPFLQDVAADAHTSALDFITGVRAFRDARAAVRSRNLDDGATKFEQAAYLLARAGSSLALAASILSASNDSYCAKGEAAYARITSLDAQLIRYPSLGAEAQWVLGLIEARRGEHSEALRSFRKGLDLARSARETEHELALAALIATELDDLEDPDEADRYRAIVLRRIDDIGASPQRLYVAIAETAQVALRRQRPRVALSFIESQEELARIAADPLLLAEAATARAMALRDMGRLDAAAASLAFSRDQASRVPTLALRERALADTEYVEAIVWKQRDPRKALSVLSSAIVRWQGNGWRYHVAAARLTIGDIRIANGDRPGAEADFRAGIAEMEQERGALEEPRLRVTYFERADDLFERLVEMLIDQHRYVEALSIAERKRSRVLLDAAVAVDGRTAGSVVPLSAEAIQRALPPSTVLLELEMLPRGAMIWLIARDGITNAHSTARGDDIAASVKRQRQAIAELDNAALRREGTWLYQQLISSVAAKIPPDATIVVVPDRALFALPFAAVIDGRGRYLVESHSIVIAPSATLYANVAAAAPTHGNVLAVAQPAPRDLPLLEYARDETEQLANVYGGAAIFIGNELTPQEFLRRGADANVISFAGHSTAHALIFESRGQQLPTLLHASDIAGARFRARPLVVLAACSTGRGNVRSTEGVDSLATAFIGAGARSVVATLWDIEDEASSRLFLAFHRNIRRGISPAQSLRDAQRSMLQSHSERDRQPVEWAAVFLMGSL